MRPVVNTEKHMSQRSLFTIATGAIDNFVLCSSVAAPTGATQVREGAKVSAVYLEMWVHSSDAVAGTTIVTLEKLIGSSTNMGAGEAASLNTYDNKKNILYTQMGIVGDNNQYPTAVIRGWIKIPKSKQRFSLGDRIVLNIFAQTNPVNVCGFVLYKEQY